MREYARLSSLGFEFSATVALLGWLGWLLDEWTGLSESFPAGLLLGVFLGLGLGIYRMQLKLNDKPQDDSSSKDSES
ncbi:MAG: AtpZ/AtpI family protein [Planctomycetota bacterium]|nr:AtpZ/AtpI family protein [Planctomycetota bacterium]MDA1112981.1 AtpZ/AtpI family protein [Planctomycetota bacterium]